MVLLDGLLHEVVPSLERAVGLLKLCFNKIREIQKTRFFAEFFMLIICFVYFLIFLAFSLNIYLVYIYYIGYLDLTYDLEFYFYFLA